jgi:hypothetical protein
MHRLYGFEKEIGVTSGGHLKVGPGPANHLKIPGKNSGKKIPEKIPEKFVTKKESRLLPSPHAADPFCVFLARRLFRVASRSICPERSKKMLIHANILARRSATQ